MFIHFKIKDPGAIGIPLVALLMLLNVLLTGVLPAYILYLVLDEISAPVSFWVALGMVYLFHTAVGAVAARIEK